MSTSEALTLRQARQEYFERNGLGDGGYTARWVKFQMGPIPFAIPNTEARKKAVKLHDLPRSYGVRDHLDRRGGD